MHVIIEDVIESCHNGIVAIYRAILSEIDPSPVESIDYIKRKI